MDRRRGTGLRPGCSPGCEVAYLPTDGVLRASERQQLAVVADYSDGSTRDVTRQAEFRSNLEVVATVEPDGLVKAGQQSGEAAIMARHMGSWPFFGHWCPTGRRLPIFLISSRTITWMS